MKGRKQKPEHLKVMEGTARPDRKNPDAPEPANELPEPPAWLSIRARGHFAELRARIEKQGYASSSHTEALGLAAMRLDEIETCSELIDSEGYTYTTSNKHGDEMNRTHPAVTQRNEAARHLQSLLAEFGLSPASVNKVSKRGGKKEADPLSKYLGKTG